MKKKTSEYLKKGKFIAKELNLTLYGLIPGITLYNKKNCDTVQIPDWLVNSLYDSLKKIDTIKAENKKLLKHLVTVKNRVGYIQYERQKGSLEKSRIDKLR